MYDGRPNRLLVEAESSTQSVRCLSGDTVRDKSRSHWPRRLFEMCAAVADAYVRPVWHHRGEGLYVQFVGRNHVLGIADAAAVSHDIHRQLLSILCR